VQYSYYFIDKYGSISRESESLEGERLMKKRLSLLLFVLVIGAMLIFTGCGKKEAAPQAAAPAVAAPAPAPAPAAPAVDKDAVLLEAGQNYFAQLATSNNMIGAADVRAMLDDNPDAVVLVDIRSAADFEEGHIEGAYHSAWADLGDVMEKIPTNRQVVVVCYSGQTAGQALAALRMAGFTNAKSLTGGMNGWRAAGLEASETGARPLSGRNNVTSPKGAEQEVLWAAAKANFVSVGKDGNKIIQGQQLLDAIETNPKAFNIIDIRSKDDFDAGHVQGSSQIAWAQFGTLLPTLAKNGKHVIVCYSGQTAGQTVGVLRVMGFDAYSLAGGINNGWKPAGLPLVQ
jgi:rhodanese-related sulfurtransferase